MKNNNELDNIIECTNKTINDVLLIKNEISEIKNLSKNANRFLKLAESLTQNSDLNEFKVSNTEKTAMYREKMSSIDKVL